MSDTALELAHAALCTPSLDASDSLDVLVDVLLEQGKVTPRAFRHKQATDSGRAALRADAWKWANEATLTVLGKITRAVDMVNRTAARPSHIMMNPVDFASLQEMLSAGMITTTDAVRFMGLPDLGIRQDRGVPRGTMYSVPTGMLDAQRRAATLDDAAAFALPDFGTWGDL